MANVKFYRLGLNGGVSNASYLEYTKIADGRIVFAQVKGENAGDPLEHYIWANGVEYHVADVSALHKIEHTLNVLLDGAPIDTSIGKMIQDALDGYELTAENFVKLVDSSNSNVKVSILDSSLVLEADSATTDDVTTTKTVGYVTSGMTIPEGTTLQQLVDMIFTKIRGLEGATSAKVTLSNVPGNTHEIGELIDVALSATYTDGAWINEERWGAGTQAYQSSASGYTFKLNNVETNNGVYDDYVVKATNVISVTATHTASTVVPKNENGSNLTQGTVNDTEHYIPFTANTTVSASKTFYGYYKYWIGYTAVKPENLTRANIESDFVEQTSGLATTNTITYTPEYSTPKYSYVTIIAPSEYSLTEAFIEAFNVANTFTITNLTDIGLSTSKTYKAFTLLVEAADTIKIKQIKLQK